MKKEIIGWLGGYYDRLSIHDNKKDAERGHYKTSLLMGVAPTWWLYIERQYKLDNK